MSGRPSEEYNGFCIQLEQTPAEIMTGDRYWKFNVWRIGKHLGQVEEQARSSTSNGKQYGGYEVALAEAKNFIDETNKNAPASR